MTSLTDDAYVGTLHYKVLDPPVGGSPTPPLQDVCAIGNTTDTDVRLIAPAAQLTLEGTSAPKIKYISDDIYVDRGLTDNNIRMGFQCGNTNVTRTIDMGTNVGARSGNNCINIGEDCASAPQTDNNICIGYQAATGNQRPACIAIGYQAGQDGQGNGGGGESVAVGGLAGQRNQGTHSTAVGQSAGNRGQGEESIALGYKAGNNRQGQASVAVGTNAAGNLQGVNSIAIGYDCASATQGDDCIAIGSVGSNQPSGSCVLSAGGVVLTPLNVGFYVKPIRGSTNPAGGVANSLWYDTGTDEVMYHIP